ncbi:MAG TPA: hypothetical protein VL981_03025 [Candidatus Methylacidiphilales bacterium]|nr:hypothetical protein [Candidatus Methylacidiphilales bacterium]
MSAETSDVTLIVDAVPKLVEILKSLTPEARGRAISSAMIVFGEPALAVGGGVKSTATPEIFVNGDGISGKALAWMKKSSITREELDHVYSIEKDSIEVIASKMPASSKRQQTVQAYLLSGLKSFLLTGDLAFTDKDSREVCQKVGCYDGPNHANYTKAFKNLLGGSKDSGWKLTNPGLTEAAKLIKSLAPGTHA